MSTVRVGHVRRSHLGEPVWFRALLTSHQVNVVRPLAAVGHSQDNTCPRPSLPHLNNQGSDLPSNAIMLYPSFFLSCQLNFCMLKKIFFPESTFMKSHYSVRALLPRSSNSRGCYKKKHLCTLSPNPNFLLGSKINLGQLCASTSRRGGRPHLAK